MIDALKTLFENDVVSSEIKAEIEEAWNAKIQENKMQATAELREEFATKYEHDKETMVEAIDNMLSERLKQRLQSLQTIVNNLQKQKQNMLLPNVRMQTYSRTLLLSN